VIGMLKDDGGACSHKIPTVFLNRWKNCSSQQF